MSAKPFKSYDELINLLISRGVNISNASLDAFARKCLRDEGYYNLINGYKTQFLEPKTSSKDEDTFKTGTTVNEIYALYHFDRVLRGIFLKYILIIETNIKSYISYSFTKCHTDENYLIYSNFDTSKREAEKNITSLISEFQRQIASRYSDPCISHYLREYGYVPLWVLNNVLTLGNISKFYSNMKQPERQDVAKHYGIPDDVLESALFYLSKIRNFCAHDNRLYCFRNTTPYTNTKLHDTLNIPKTDKNGNHEYSYGKRDLFAAVIILKQLLPKQAFKSFVKKVNSALDNLRAKMNVLSEDEILIVMGFPKNWRELVLK